MKYTIQPFLKYLALEPASNTLMISYSVPGIDAYELSQEVLVLVEEETATIHGIVCDITNKQNIETIASKISGVKVVKNHLVVNSPPRNINAECLDVFSDISTELEGHTP